MLNFKHKKLVTTIACLVVFCMVTTCGLDIAVASDLDPPIRLLPNESMPSWLSLYFSDRQRFLLDLENKGVDPNSISSISVPGFIGGLSSMPEPSPFKFLLFDPSQNPAFITIGVGLPEVKGLELKFKW